MPTHLLCQMYVNPPEVEFKGPSYPSSDGEMKFRRCLFVFSIIREIRHFHALVVQKRAKQKGVMHVRSCCFAY